MAKKPASFIRQAILADAAEIARLASQLGYPTSDEELLRRLESLLNRRDHFIGVVAAEEKPRLLGWITAEVRDFLVTSARVEIMGLVVDREARRQGIGQVLIAEVETWAQERGVADIVVRSNIVRSDSHPFYEQLGYQREKSQHVYLKHLR